MQLQAPDRASVEGSIGRLEDIASDLRLMKGDYMDADDDTGDHLERAEDAVDEALRFLRQTLKA